jgi:pimeloyl-ACP methyl ester carboxylesterase
MCWRSIARSWRTSRPTRAPRGASCSLALTFCAVATLTACATSKPDLRRLYQTANVATEQLPLILIPGIMGSQLRDRATHRVVWPGNLWNLIFNRFDELALDVDPATLVGGAGKLEAFDITNAAAGHRFYQSIVETMVQFGGYQLTQLGTHITDPYERHMYVFPYDWRLDNVETARRLAAFIDQLRRDYDRPDLKADIVAHSMGGIVSRYLLNFGTEDVLDRDDAQVTMAGASRINRLVLLGTPSLGSANAVRVLIEGQKIVQLIQPEVLATLPSTYQLLPNADRKPLIGIDGRPLRKNAQDATSPERSIFDVDTWRDLKWSVFDPQVIARVGPQRAELLQRYFAKHLKRAGRLQKALRLPQPASAARLIVFGADCALTPARVLVEDQDGSMVPRYEPQQIRLPQPGPRYDELLREPGDGTVGKASLLGRQSLDPTVHGSNQDGFPIAFSFFLCAEHSQIPSNINFQDNLLNALLSR